MLPTEMTRIRSFEHVTQLCIMARIDSSSIGDYAPTNQLNTSECFEEAAQLIGTRGQCNYYGYAHPARWQQPSCLCLHSRFGYPETVASRGQIQVIFHYYLIKKKSVPGNSYQRTAFRNIQLQQPVSEPKKNPENECILKSVIVGRAVPHCLPVLYMLSVFTVLSRQQRLCIPVITSQTSFCLFFLIRDWIMTVW